MVERKTVSASSLSPMAKTRHRQRGALPVFLLCFEQLYASQSTYVKISDRPLAEQRRIAREYGRKQAESLMPRPKVPTDKALYTPRELAILLDVTEKEVYNMLKRETLPARKINGRFWISRESLQSYLTENNIILAEWMEE